MKRIVTSLGILCMLLAWAFGPAAATASAQGDDNTVYLPSILGVAAEQAFLDAAAAAGSARVIVIMRDRVENPGLIAADLARRTGGRVEFVYRFALKGALMSVPASAIADIERSPWVEAVEEDAVVELYEQSLPTGIQRIFAPGNANLDIDNTDDKRVDVDVAVIDTGVDFQHPDLNVAGGVDCTGGGLFRSTCVEGGDDDHFHGTHVAGIIGALDNNAGVVGVAPGARIWAVKVLNNKGRALVSWIVAGIDWVADHANTIEVANMSFGGLGNSRAQFNAIQGAVNRGVAFAAAAGNSDANAGNFSPARFNNVLTVSALADFNGQPGGGAASTCRADQDDTLADFSNWGSAVDVAAPGVCILSTYPMEQGGYGTISGTSMASPHAAGALALLASRNNPNNATAVNNLYNQVKSAGNLNWTDDSGDGVKEPLLDVSNPAIFNPVLQ